MVNNAQVYLQKQCNKTLCKNYIVINIAYSWNIILYDFILNEITKLSKGFQTAMQRLHWNLNWYINEAIKISFDGLDVNSTCCLYLINNDSESIL